MLRYRVALMLLLFFFLGIFSSPKSGISLWSYLFAIFSLSFSYIAATTINDITDQKIDAVNHPESKGRPLVNRTATVKDLYILNLSASLFALVSAVFLGLYPFIIVWSSILINYFYSLPPFKFSHRTHLTTVILCFAYVSIPFTLGVILGGNRLANLNAVLLIALLFLFCGRIILKDFRDRKGDLMYGKPTFLLKYGKKVTCLISLLFVLIGNVILFFTLPNKHIFILLTLELYFLAIYSVALKLWKENETESEQTAIGIGAKMGNGLLITVLGLLILNQNNSSLETQMLFAVTLTLSFLINFFFLLTKPNYATIGYKG